MASAADEPKGIYPTDKEQRTGRYEAKNLQAALESLHQDGLVVLKDVVDVQHIDHLREVMTAETTKILESPERQGVYNQGVASNILQFPPVHRADCLFNDVFFNPHVVQVANAYLGAVPITNFMTANNALAGTGGMRQPVHKDITFDHAECPFYFIANIVLSDFTTVNGATEFWLGSHAHAKSSEQIPCTAETRVQEQIVGDPSCNVQEHHVEARRLVRPPVRAICQKGDILIRDLRTWHAGMPNESEEDRIMIAIGYQAPWYPNHSQRLFLPLEQAEFFMTHGEQPIELRANFLTEGEMPKMLQNYDFSFASSSRIGPIVKGKL